MIVTYATSCIRPMSLLLEAHRRYTWTTAWYSFTLPGQAVIEKRKKNYDSLFMCTLMALMPSRKNFDPVAKKANQSYPT